MTVVAVAPAPAGHTVSAAKIGDRAIALLVFLGAFVIYEPAPYELLLCVVLFAWLIAGLRINRYILPLVLLFLAFIVGCALSLTQLPDPPSGILYLAVSGLLAVSAMFFAAVIPEAPERRLKLIVKAYTAGAVIAAMVGILGYFGIIPGGEFFTLYGRAKGPFQDPNVFGPFLVLPFVYLVHTILTGRPRDMRWQALFAMVILTAIFLTFSRAAWAMTALALLITTTVAYINQRSGAGRVRIMGYMTAGFLLVIVLVGVMLSLPGTGDLFSQRAQLVQYYDGGEGGRFDRWIQGFIMMLDHPLGIGPLEFGARYFAEDEHNTWLKAFTTYGWLGGVAYVALAIWTVIITVPLLFKPRPWRAVVVCAFAVFIGQLSIHFVIDNDHWRHLFLLYGILWGAYAAERMYMRGSAAMPRVPPVPTFRVALERGPGQALPRPL